MDYATMIPNIQTDPEGVFFIPFLKPKTQLEKCERWIKNCGRPKEQFNISRVTKDTFICSKNFVGGNGPTVDHPDPIPATAIGEQVRKFCKPPQLTSTPQKKKRLDTDDMMAAEALVDMSVIRHAADFSQKIKESFEISELPQKVTSATQTEPVLIVPITEDYQKLNASSQTVYSKYELMSRIETIILRNEVSTSTSSTSMPILVTDKPLLCLDTLKDDDRKMKFFTGLIYLHFMALFKFLGPGTARLNYWNRSTKPANTHPLEELLITLVRLRQGYRFYTMTYFFKLSETALAVFFPLGCSYYIVISIP